MGDNSQNADGRSHNFQRQRSFATKDNNQRRLSPLTSGNSPPRTQGYLLLNKLYLMDNVVGFSFSILEEQMWILVGQKSMAGMYLSRK